MPTEVLRLSIDSRGAEAGAKRLESSTDRLNQRMRTTSLALAAAGAASLALGREYDNAQKTIVQGTGATGAALDGLLGSFRNLSGTVTGDVAGAIADVNTHFGVTGTELESLAMRALQAQQAFGSFDIGQLGQAARSFNLDAGQTGELLDRLGTVAQSTGQSMGSLVSDVRTFGPVARNLGLSAAETATFFGQLNSAGVDVSRVMPGLNAAMRRAAQEGVTDLRGHLDQAIGSIRAASTDTEALNIATETFGAEGAQRMVSAIRSGVLPSLSQLNDVYGDTTGRTQEAYEATLTLGDRMQLLRGRIVGLAGPAANTVGVLGSMGAALTGIVPILPRLAVAFRGLWAAITGPVGLVITGITALGTAFFVFRRQIGDVLASTIQIIAGWADRALEGFQSAFSWIPGLEGRMNDARAAVANFANDAGAFVDDLGESMVDAAEGADRLGFGAVGAAGDLGTLGDAMGAVTVDAAAMAEEMERAAGVVDSLAPRTQKTSRQIEVMGRELNELRPHALGAAEALQPLRTQTRELPSVFQTAWDNIRSVFTSDSLADAVNSIFGSADIKRALGEQGKAAATLLGNAFASALSAVPVVGPFIAKLGPALGQGITTLAGRVGGFLKGLFGGGEEAAEEMSLAAQTAFDEVAAAAEESAERALAAHQAAVDQFQTFIDGVSRGAVGAYMRAAEGSQAAYDMALQAALDFGFGAEEAARIAADAQIFHIRRALREEGERHALLAGFEAALAEIRAGNAAGAAEAARRAADQTRAAWRIATDQIIEADNIMGGALRGNAMDTSQAQRDAAKDVADNHERETQRIVDKDADAGMMIRENTRETRDEQTSASFAAANAARISSDRMVFDYGRASAAAGRIAGALRRIPTEVMSTVTITTIRREIVQQVGGFGGGGRTFTPGGGGGGGRTFTPDGGSGFGGDGDVQQLAERFLSGDFRNFNDFLVSEGITDYGPGGYLELARRLGFYGTGDPRSGGPGGGPFSFQTGSGGLRDFGAGTLAQLHGREAVVTDEQINRMIAAAAFGGARAARAEGGPAGGQRVTWNFQPGAIRIDARETPPDELLNEIERAARSRTESGGYSLRLS